MSSKSTPPVSNVFSCPPDVFIARLAEKLKSFPEINVPKEAQFWKTSCAQEFPPEDSVGFWYTRSASLMRKLAIHKVIGIQRLRKVYSSLKRRGHKPPISQIAAGGIIRRCLQQLEKAGLVQVEEKKGRKLTPAGQSLVDKISHEILRETSQA